jgi:hypothetical protein
MFEYEYWVGNGFTNCSYNAEEWILEVIHQNPGLWVAEICRIMHDHPSTTLGIAFCGLCQQYANPRKRLHARNSGPEIPGLEGNGAYKLHPACSDQDLTWLRHLIYRLERTKLIVRVPNSKIPDSRQPRGWDFGTRIYPKRPDLAL